jgi:ferric iron reductase protein FhuF
MTPAIEVLDRVTSTVDYLRVTVGDGSGATDWLPCDGLVSDPVALGELARATAAGRGTDRDDVAMSLLVQGYAFRIASVAIGAWLLGDAVLDVSPAGMAIAVGRHRPNAVRFDEPRLVTTDDPLRSLHAELVDGHLAPLVATAHQACRVGEALLWSNVGASCASAFGAFMGPLPDRHEEIRDRTGAFFAAARGELACSGRVVPVGTAWAWERKACCLWYRTTGGSRCADCSLWSDEERRERYDAAITAQAGACDERGGSA